MRTEGRPWKSSLRKKRPPPTQRQMTTCRPIILRWVCERDNYLLQNRNPFFHNYDLVCFDVNGPRIEKRIVHLDDEAILEHAPSFVDLVAAALRRGRAWCGPRH